MSSWFDRRRRRGDRDDFWEAGGFFDPDPDDLDEDVRRHEGGIRGFPMSFDEIDNFGEPANYEEDVLVDVYREGDEVVVLADLKGAKEKSISVGISGRFLEIRAGGRYRRYYKTVYLPTRVEPKGMRKRFVHGLLEIRLRVAGR